MKSVDTSLKSFMFPNINDDGWKFISISAFFSLILLIIWIPLGCIAIILTVWCFYAFRDPERVTPNLSDIIVAPSDGKIVTVTREKGPEVLGLGNKTFIKISIVSNIFDVNVTRVPAKSKVINLFYDSGTKFLHSPDKNNINNERMLIAFKSTGGREIVVQQTTTLCSARIRNNLQKGDEFLTGQRFGIMRFGGYIDLYLPEKSSLMVCLGQTLVGGETIVADLNSDAPRIDGEIR